MYYYTIIIRITHTHTRMYIICKYNNYRTHENNNGRSGIDYIYIIMDQYNNNYNMYLLTMHYEKYARRFVLLYYYYDFYKSWGT